MFEKHSETCFLKQFLIFFKLKDKINLNVNLKSLKFIESKSLFFNIQFVKKSLYGKLTGLGWLRMKFLALSSMRWHMSGIPNASVLPLPVSAAPNMSLRWLIANERTCDLQ